MKCPTCVAEGKRSRVYGGHIPPSDRTCRFWDEDGIVHIHDPHKYFIWYECSNGHKWSESIGPHTCETCGWTNEPTRPGPLEVRNTLGAGDEVEVGGESPALVRGNPPFRRLDAFHTTGPDGSRDRVVIIVELDRHCTDFDWLRGHDVEIDGVARHCVAVDAFCTVSSSPGTKIGIAVEDEHMDDD